MAIHRQLVERVIYLGVDTSMMTQSVAVMRDDEVLASRTARRARGHAESLLITVEAALQSAGCTHDDVDELVCGLGPGSFTGVRIGLAFMLGFAAAHGQNVFGVDSLRAYTAFLPTNVPIAVAADARKSEVYGVIYNASSAREAQRPAATYAPADFFAMVADHPNDAIVLVGNGPDAFADAWAPYRTCIERIVALRTPPATGLILAHRQGFSRSNADALIEPRYIRASDARKPQRPL